MSSRSLTSFALVWTAATMLSLSGCNQDAPRKPSTGQPGGPALGNISQSGLLPGDAPIPDKPNPRAVAYYNNPEAVERGMLLYKKFNCTGCHFNGGGGIGPPLMDNDWIYGGRLDQIFNSINQGRPNGMPSWAGKIPEQQIWEIAAYVRSMSLPQTLAAAGTGTPSQHPAPVPPEADMHEGWKIPGAPEQQPPAEHSEGQQP